MAGSANFSVPSSVASSVEHPEPVAQYWCTMPAKDARQAGRRPSTSLEGALLRLISTLMQASALELHCDFHGRLKICHAVRLIPTPLI